MYNKLWKGCYDSNFLCTAVSSTNIKLQTGQCATACASEQCFDTTTFVCETSSTTRIKGTDGGCNSGCGFYGCVLNILDDVGVTHMKFSL